MCCGLRDVGPVRFDVGQKVQIFAPSSFSLLFRYALLGIFDGPSHENHDVPVTGEDINKTSNNIHDLPSSHRHPPYFVTRPVRSI